MNIQYKHVNAKIVGELSDQGIIEAYVSIFGNVDSYNERVVYGAFKDTIANDKPPVMAWSHDWNKPIGKTLEIEEVPAGDPRLPDSIKSNGGLRVRGQISMGVSWAKDAYELIKDGVIDEFSIGYTVDGEAYDADGVRDLTKVTLMEWSPVLRGANPATVLTGFKSLNIEQQADAIEELLQQLHGHAKAHADMRVKVGRAISAARFARLVALADAMDSSLNEFRSFLSEHDPTKSAPNTDGYRLAQLYKAQGIF